MISLASIPPTTMTEADFLLKSKLLCVLLGLIEEDDDDVDDQKSMMNSIDRFCIAYLIFQLTFCSCSLSATDDEHNPVH